MILQLDTYLHPARQRSRSHLAPGRAVGQPFRLYRPSAGGLRCGPGILPRMGRPTRHSSRPMAFGVELNKGGSRSAGPKAAAAFLADRHRMAEFCAPPSGNGAGDRYAAVYGVKLKTVSRTYLLRCDPRKGETNFCSMPTRRAAGTQCRAACRQRPVLQAPLPQTKKTPAERKHVLAGVGFVTAAGCDASREGTVSGFDGVVAVVDTNDHGMPRFLYVVYTVIYLQSRKHVPSRVAMRIKQKPDPWLR